MQFSRNSISTKFGGVLINLLCPVNLDSTLLNVESNHLVFWKTYNTETDDIIITFNNQNGRPLETEDRVNLTLLINT